MEQYISKIFPDGASIDAALARSISGGALGAASKELTSNYDLDTITQNGWYRWGSSVPKNAPVTSSGNSRAYAFMRVSNYDSNNCIQEFWNINDDAKYKLQRICRNSAWQPIEWVNPPMVKGKEYRTTERWNENPVYAKLIYGGKSAAGDITEIPYGVAVSGLVEQVITVDYIQQPFAITDNNYKILVDACSSSKVIVKTGSSMGDKDIYVRIKYTK